MADVDPKATRFVAMPENLAAGRAFLRNYLIAAGWPGSDLDVVIALGEVLQNIIRHGFHGGNENGEIKLLAQIKNDLLIVIIEDDAAPSMPQEWSGEGRAAHQGGLGLGIVRRIASHVEFRPTATGNRARLEFIPE